MSEETILYEKIVTNVKSKAREVTLNGREYYVVPGTLLVSGVLPGSKGPLYYPPEEVIKTPDIWNGVPLVGYHPVINGIPVSARNPTILDKQQLGYVFNTTGKEDRLPTEYWFDKELTAKFDQTLLEENRLIPRIIKGEMIETSTGVYTTNVKASEGANHNGVPYGFVAKNYRPDHVAVLPDEVGACSTVDGCGVHVTNKKTLLTRILNAIGLSDTDVSNFEEESKKQLVDNELSHSDIRFMLIQALKGSMSQSDPYCYVLEVYDDYFIFEQGDKCYRVGYEKDDTGVTLDGTPTEVVRDVSYVPVTTNNTLNSDQNPISSEETMALTPDQRKTKVEYLVTNCTCWKGSQAVLNTLSDDQLLKVEEDSKPKSQLPLSTEQVDQLAVILKEKLTPTSPVQTVPIVTPPVVTTPVIPVAPVVTANEWLASAPPEIRNVVNNALQLQNTEKQNLVNMLVVNVSDPTQKQQHSAFLMTKDLQELRILAGLMPTPMPAFGQPPVARFDLFGGAPVVNSRGTDETPLLCPQMDYTTN